MFPDPLSAPRSFDPAPARDPVYVKRRLVDGRLVDLRCVDVLGKTFALRGRFVRTAALEDEWFDDLEDPEAAVRELRGRLRRPPDILSFWQRPPEVEPRFPYPHEWEELAVLPIESYERWWTTRIKARVRNQIRKAERDGLVVREVDFDDHFVRGMTAIFNESPVRQGRPFWHYGKSFETVREQFSAFVHRETMIGAYLDGRMIGFVMLANAGRFGLTTQVLSSLAHRDKAPSNALIAKAVEACASRGLRHLVYFHWGDDSLAEFKRRCGFEPVRTPRYFVPLTRKGRLAIACGLHRGWKALLPAPVKDALKRARRRWYARSGR